ncbi:MAG: hypothetical protein LBK56_08705 [Gracilibacteraceae bacterium]|jgi:hypothetical protein|nr:hypothetical protein [Gracilibacteraceae bacterium]
MEHRLMNDQEIAEIYRESHRLEAEGRKEEAMAKRREAPLPAFLAKVMKEKLGGQYVIQSGWNLAEAETKFGANWLNR